jgi:hypothetical protein
MIQNPSPRWAAALALMFLLAADNTGKIMFNGKDLSGWKFVSPAAADSWSVAQSVAIDPSNDKKLSSVLGDGILLRGDVEHGSDIYTEKTFGDCEVHVEFMIPKGSNSGVYLMGQYEVQVFDSSGIPDEKLRPGDCGGIYHFKAPSTNAMTPPGEWQTYDIIFRAPRFDAAGKKTENAKFISVIFNGKKIHENVEAPGPTGGELPGGEKSTGPLMFQGNHGIVAFRNVRVKPVELK